MDKKSLIGISICAVILLVLGSLSNVIGYQSVKSTAVNESPLFRTRTQRAINQQQNILISQYLGKDKGINFFLPYKNNKSESLKTIINSIKKMDDVSLQELGYLITSVYNYKIKDFENRIDNKKILSSLNELRDTPIDIIYDIINDVQKSKDSLRRSDICTLFCTLDVHEQGCFFEGLFFLILILFDVLIVLPIQYILWLFTISWVMVCTTQYPPCH
jgi:hypothetical protein